MSDWWLRNPEDLQTKIKVDIVDPAVSDDFSKGYDINSKWTNTFTQQVFTCIDNTNGAAVWARIDGSGTLVETSGTFTPEIWDDTNSGAEGQTYSNQAGFYTRQGDLVFFWLDMTITSLGTLTTGQNAGVGGLPFVSNASNLTSVTVGLGEGLALTALSSVTGIIGGNSNRVNLREWNVAGGTIDLVLSKVTAAGRFIISGQYKV